MDSEHDIISILGMALVIKAIASIRDMLSFEDESSSSTNSELISSDFIAIVR